MIPSSGQRKREAFFSLVGRQLPPLYHFVQHQLAYHESLGDLTPAAIRPEEVVDAVLLRAYRLFAESSPSGRKVRSWLVGLARDEIRELVQQARAAQGGLASLEQNIPEVPPAEQVVGLGEEMLEFYEPEEDFRLEDVVPDLRSATPEDAVAREEVILCTDAALAGMPREWRRALVLRHVEGVKGAKLAKAIGRTVPQTRRILENARQYLRQHLVEAGYRPEPEQDPPGSHPAWPSQELTRR